MATTDRVLREVEAACDELVDFAAQLIRIPTVNPPGDLYRECAELIGARLTDFGYDVDYVTPEGGKRGTVADEREEHKR